MKLPHFLAGLILVGTAAALAIPDTISGPARVIDGDTLEIDSKRIRLFGIDAPERSQPQGPAATAYLQRLLHAPVTCHPKSTDKYGRIVAQCFALGRDVGGLMVASGHAVDYGRYSGGHYRDHEAAARAEHLGIWSGPFVNPENYRAAQQKR